jgi:long-chain acyl-CoA synthetase
MVKAFHVDPEPFSVENDLLTPTFKLKRPQAAKKYKDIIATMYGELGE